MSRVSSEVEAESKKVIEGTQMEAESSERILASVEELDRSVGEINSSVEKVTTSAEEVTVAVDEMVTNTEQIAQNTVELSTAVDSTSSSIEEMSISIQEIAERTKELTVSSEDTLSAIEEINSAVREIDANTGESARLSEKVMTDASGFGMEAIVKTAEGMEKIKTSVQTTAQFIEVLSARSIQIGRILNVINEITDQTTLLALNAAILAAQAGEHGKGFSVVADEIKSLAERTTLSTQEIETLINSVQSEVVGASDAMYRGLNIVEEGTVLANDAKEALKKIIESAKKSTEMASSVQISTSEQAKAIKFVTDSMEKNKEMIGHIAKATSEQAKGVSLILSVSEKIRDITKQVKNANLEQAKGGKLIYNATENVTVQIHSISNAIKEQKLGSGEILNSLFKLKDMPEKVKKRAYIMNSTLRNLQKDSELLLTELGRFKIEHRKKEAGVINFGVMPLESPAEMYKRFIPLIDYLSIKLNKKIELYNAVDFVETVRNIGEGITDVSYMTPSTYIEARDKYNVEVLAKALNKGKPYHRCAIIAKDGGKINSIENLRGCSFAFGDKYSTSSYIVPRAMLSEAGIDIKDLSFYAFLGRHDDVANAVLNGEFEAGGVMETTAEKFRGRGIKIIKYSFEVPEFNICVNRALPDEEKRLIKRAFLDLNENNDEQRDILHAINPGYTGFVDSSDGDYEEIRNIMQRFKLR
ncbi:MAG: phosphate/phosphite/phosphonate ABC transporter substrate-binding protein [Nitrospirae bacterium]|nr:phosphate/phosphite/phosphonate ABC transporter substrate-binding protein [Nitrospirota bacterium]